MGSYGFDMVNIWFLYSRNQQALDWFKGRFEQEDPMILKTHGFPFTKLDDGWPESAEEHVTLVLLEVVLKQQVL